MKYSEDQKQRAFLQYLCGYTPKEIAGELDIHLTTVYRWIDQWKKNLEGLTLAELPIQDMGMILTNITEMQKKLDEQERMISIIHESCVLQTIPLKQRIDMAMKHLDTYSAAQLCDIFEIKLSTLYYHIKLARKGTNRQQEENHLCAEIAGIFEESGKRFGAEQIRLQLKKQGIRVGKKRIIRLMKKMGFYCEDLERSWYRILNASDLEDTQDVQILQ